MDSVPKATVSLSAISSSGEWKEPEELCESAVQALRGTDNVQISLAPGHYLDASALQILLSLSIGLTKDGRTLELTHVSVPMEKWFGYAGATELLDAARSATAVDKASAQ